jgi:hypothetical protein
MPHEPFLGSRPSSDPFVVASGPHTITFQGLNTHGGDNTAFIDTVEVTAEAIQVSSASVPPLQQPGFEGGGWNPIDTTTITTLYGESGHDN